MVPESKGSNVVKFSGNIHVETEPDQPSKVKVKDKDDRWVLESAISANADILVTGDKELLI